MELPFRRTPYTQDPYRRSQWHRAPGKWKYLFAIDFEGIRVLIPGNEMFMDSWPEGTSPPIRYQIRLNRILGATIDFSLPVLTS